MAARRKSSDLVVSVQTLLLLLYFAINVDGITCGTMLTVSKV